MIVKYEDVSKSKDRLIIFLFGVPLTLIVCLAFTFTWIIPMTQEAIPIMDEVWQGNFENLKGLGIYFGIVPFIYGCSGALFFGILYGSLYCKDRWITFDFERKVVHVKEKRPFVAEQEASYPFSDVQYVELKEGSQTQSDHPEIWLHLQSRKKPFRVVQIFDYTECFQEFRNLVDLGLPKKPKEQKPVF